MRFNKPDFKTLDLKTLSFKEKVFRKKTIVIFLVCVLIAAFFVFKNNTGSQKTKVTTAGTGGTGASVQASLTVTTIKPQMTLLNQILNANGNIAAWQESSISSEASDLLLREVLVTIGDHVKRGQVLARFSTATIEADIAQLQANVAEAKATLAEASSNANRARSIQDSGALSQQQIEQYLTAETNAKARLHAAQANLHAKNIRLGQAVVKAPDDGVISLNPATVGTVYGVGKELFRLIRKGRIEWRAELTSADLSRIKPGMKATITLPDKSVIQGTVRTISPVVDARTRNAIVYVDIPAGSASIGMFARGDFMLGAMESLTLPNDAIVMRDGFAYVMQVETIGNSQQARIRQVQVKLGQRSGKRVALLNFNLPEADFVASGGAFLADGDTVRVVAHVESPTQTGVLP